MAGELWRGSLQVGKETTYGTPVAATRLIYATEPVLTIEKEAMEHRFPFGRRDNVGSISSGPIQAGGTLTVPMSAAEILEPLLIGLKGGVTPTGTDAKVWVFTPANSLDSMTVEWNDGANCWQGKGFRADSLNISGEVSGENTLTAELFGADLVKLAAMTSGLTHRVPQVFNGWETSFAVGPAGAVPSTATDCTLLSWDINIQNGMARQYAAKNAQSACDVTLGEQTVESTLTVVASNAAAIAEFDAWIAGTSRVVKLTFGNNQTIGTGSEKEKVEIVLPGKATAFDLGQTDENSRAYEISLMGVYDSTLAYTVQVTCTTARAAAW